MLCDQRRDIVGDVLFDAELPLKVLQGQLEDFVAVSFAGHGANSYALSYCLVDGPLALFLQTAWGGVYTDAEKAASAWRLVVSHAQRLLHAARLHPGVNARDPEERLLVVNSDFRGSGTWAPFQSPLGGDAAQALPQRRPREASVDLAQPRQRALIAATSWAESAWLPLTDRTDVPAGPQLDGLSLRLPQSRSAPVTTEPSPPIAEELDSGADSVPSIDNLLEPTLEVLATHDSAQFPAVVREVADHLDLSEEIRSRRIKSGRTVLANRMGWARTSLGRAGLLTIPAPAQVSITPAGRSLLAAHRGAIDGALLARECPSYASWLADMGNSIVETERAADDDSAAVWTVRAGEAGRFTFDFAERGRIMVGWGATGSVERLDRDAIAERVAAASPELGRLQRGQATNALLRLASEMRSEDVIITPEPATRTLLLGRISGEYEYAMDTDGCDEYNHQRPVRWIARVSRDDFSYGARQSLGTLLTLTKFSHAAETQRILEAHADDEPPAPLRTSTKNGREPERVGRVNVPANAVVQVRALREAFQLDRRRITSLLDQLDTGELALPDFQRSFVWEPDATRELLVSMIRSFPAGTLLFLQGGDSRSRRGSWRGHQQTPHTGPPI